MIIHNGLPEPGVLTDPVVAVGMFDGVHLGHRALIEEARGWAEETGADSVVLTFSGRPRDNVREKCTPLITSLEHRLSLIEKTGIDACIAIEFSRETASMGPAAFLDSMIRRELGCRRIVAGLDWRFGRNRAGGKTLLLALEKEGNLKVRFKEPVGYQGETVSSTAIREAVECGDLARAAGMLGRRFSLQAEVVRGTGRGAVLGFPTANLGIEGLVRPPDGVYAAETIIDDEQFTSVASLGTRPTFGTGPFVAEVHVIGFSGDLYGRKIEIGFVRFIRPQEDFASEEKLAAQIRKDIEAARR